MEPVQSHGWVQRIWGVVCAHPYSMLGAIVAAVLLVPLLRRDQDWVTVYMPAAERLASGQDVFSQDFVYPPINALLPLPFLGLPRVPGKLAWFTINLAALGFVIRGAWKLAGGGRIEGSPAVAWREHAIYLIGFGCGVGSCIDAVTNEQTDLIVAALVIAGCLALVNAPRSRAALWFGIAAGIKCTPLLFAPYLAWRKRWGAAGLVCVVAIAINVIPDLTHPPADGSPRLVRWVSRYLTPMTGKTHDYGTWACGLGGNQSLAGFWQRTLIYDAAWNGNDLDVTTRPNRPDPMTLKAVSFGSMLLLLGVAVACSWTGMRNRINHSGAKEPTPLAVECGMVVILMVLFSPHSSKPHFCTLLLPGFCMARAAVDRGSRWLLALAGAAVTCSMISNQDLVGSHVFAWAKWHASLAWGAVLLFAGSCWVLVRNEGAAEATLTLPVATSHAEIRKAA